MRFTNQKELELHSYARNRVKQEEKLNAIISKGHEAQTSHAIAFRNMIITELKEYLENRYMMRTGTSGNYLLTSVLFPLKEAWLRDYSDRLASVEAREVDPFFTVACIVAECVLKAKFGEIKEHSVVNAIHNQLTIIMGLTNGELRENSQSIHTETYRFLMTLEQNLGIIEIYQVNNRDRYVRLSEEWQSKFDSIKDHLFLMTTAAFVPAIQKPLQHTSLIDKTTGYHTPQWASPILKRPVRIPTISSAELMQPENKPWLEGKRKRIAKGTPYVKLPKVIHPLIENFDDENWFKQFNRIQDTPYAVNKGFLELFLANTRMGYQFEGFELELPEIDSLVDAELEKFEEDYNKEVSCNAAFYGNEPHVLSVRAKHKKRLELKRTHEDRIRRNNHVIEQAQEFAEYPELYYPRFCDYRGRFYAFVSGGLNPLGDSLNRAFLCFQNKERMTSEGIAALLQTLGNCLINRKTGIGLDKLNIHKKGRLARKFFDRHLIDFKDNNWQVFYNDNDDEVTLDEPLTAMLLCFELLRHIQDPSYETGVICHRDARCSGVSLMGASLGDEKAIGLTMLDADPETGILPDAYTSAAKAALNLAEADAKNGNPFAAILLTQKDKIFKRSIFKNPVMVWLGYAGSDGELEKYCRSVLFGVPELSDAISVGLIKYLKQNVMESLTELLPSSVRIVKANKKVANIVSRRGLKGGDDSKGVIAVNVPVSEFPMVIQKLNKVELRITPVVNGRTARPNLIEPTNKPMYQKLSSTTPPCFVHAMDASVIIAMREFAEFDFDCIHDSIGSHPNNVAEMVRCYAKAIIRIIKVGFWETIYQRLGVSDQVSIPRVSNLSEEMLQAIENSEHILV
ncbi:DNA-directed RNA polymerase [Enterovibrio baiacu]|uniref:DNA-directed RNA polymerase n=1 Tax=Enterovibrio baiacu TaxID=2491023 RepID=UPI001011FA1C|nr:DNA-directed RNA polymerase [Enterovibrio baiacu]MBE1275104.1 hypothetical protein [Enterovibrio baiacu]